MAGKGPKKAKSLEDKIRDVDASFVDEALSSTEDQLRNKLVQMAKTDEEIEQARKDDQDLATKKEELKVMGESYSEPLKANKLKRKLVLQILEGRGKL